MQSPKGAGGRMQHRTPPAGVPQRDVASLPLHLPMASNSLAKGDSGVNETVMRHVVAGHGGECPCPCDSCIHTYLHTYVYITDMGSHGGLHAGPGYLDVTKDPLDIFQPKKENRLPSRQTQAAIGHSALYLVFGRSASVRYCGKTAN